MAPPRSGGRHHGSLRRHVSQLFNTSATKADVPPVPPIPHLFPATSIQAREPIEQPRQQHQQGQASVTKAERALQGARENNKLADEQHDGPRSSLRTDTSFVPSTLVCPALPSDTGNMSRKFHSPSFSKKQPSTPAVTEIQHFQPKAKIFPQEQNDSAEDITTRHAVRQALANISGFVYKPTYEHHDLRSKPRCEAPQLLPSDAKKEEEEEQQNRQAVEQSEEETEPSDEEIRQLLDKAKKMKEEEEQQRRRDIEASKQKLRRLFDEKSNYNASEETAVPALPEASLPGDYKDRSKVAKKRARQNVNKRNKATVSVEKALGVGVARDVPVIIGWPAGVKIPDKLRTSVGRDEIFSSSHAIKIAHRPHRMANLLSEGHELKFRAEAPPATASSPRSSNSKGSKATRIPRPKTISIMSSARSAFSDETVLTAIQLERRRTGSSSIAPASTAASSPLLFMGPPFPMDSDSDNEDALSISAADALEKATEDEVAPDEFTKLLASDLVHPWPDLWANNVSGWPHEVPREDAYAYKQIRGLLVDVWMALTGQKKATQELADVFASMLPDMPDSKRSSRDSAKKRFSKESFKLKSISNLSAKNAAVDIPKTPIQLNSDCPLGRLALKSPLETRLSFGSNKSVIASFHKRNSGNSGLESFQPRNSSQRDSGHSGIFSPINTLVGRKEKDQQNFRQRNSCSDSIFSPDQPLVAREDNNGSVVPKASSGEETVAVEKTRGTPAGNLQSRKPNLTIRTSKSSAELRHLGLENVTPATEIPTPTKRSRLASSFENFFTPKKSPKTPRSSFEADEYFAVTPLDAPPVPKLPPAFARSASQISTTLPPTPTGGLFSCKTSGAITPAHPAPISAHFNRSISQLSTCTTVPPTPGNGPVKCSTSQLSTEAPSRRRSSSLFRRSASRQSTAVPPSPSNSLFGRSTPHLEESAPPTPGGARGKSKSFSSIFYSRGSKKKDQQREDKEQPLTHVDPAVFEELLEELIVSFTNWHNSNKPTSFPLTGLAVQAARALVTYTSTVLESLHDFDKDCDNIDQQHARLIWITNNFDAPMNECPFERAPDMSPEYIAAGHCDVWAMRFLAWAEEQDELARYIEHDAPATFYGYGTTNEKNGAKRGTADVDGSPFSRPAPFGKGLDAPDRCQILKRRLDWCEIDSQLAMHLHFDGPVDEMTAELAAARGEGRPLTADAARKRFEALVREVGDDARWAVCVEQIARLAGLIGRDAVAGMEAKRLVLVWEQLNQEDRVERKRVERKRRQDKATKMMMVGMGRRGMGMARAAGDESLKIRKKDGVIEGEMERERRERKDAEKRERERKER